MNGERSKSTKVAGRKATIEKLSLEAICAAALEIGDGSGVRALTMRHIAERLDVTTMALYTYVETKDELLARMTDYALDQIELRPLSGEWRDDVVMILEELRFRLRAHPAIVSVVSNKWIASRSVGLARLMDNLLQVLGRGFGEADDVVTVFTLLYRYTFGYVAFELPRAHLGSSGLREVAERRGFDVLGKSMDSIMSSLTTEQFADGVRAIINGYNRSSAEVETNRALGSP